MRIGCVPAQPPSAGSTCTQPYNAPTPAPPPRSDRVALLNQCTEVINFWQDETKHSIAEAQAKFGEDCKFVGV